MRKLSRNLDIYLQEENQKVFGSTGIDIYILKFLQSNDWSVLNGAVYITTKNIAIQEIMAQKNDTDNIINTSQAYGQLFRCS